jgi:uncharacterized membrane protein YgcG
MPGADQGPLGPDMEERLRRELDAVQPMFSSPRYLSTTRRPAALRFAPVALAAAVLGILGLTAYAGSPNPRVWTEHVFSVIHPQASPTPSQASPSAQPSPTDERHETPEPSETAEPKGSPEPNESPEPNQSPEPSGGGETGSGGSGSDGSGSGGSGSSDSGTSGSGSGGSGSGESSPQPTPTSGDH